MKRTKPHWSLTLSHTHTHTLTLSHTHTHTLTLSHTHTHTHSHSHAHSHLHTEMSVCEKPRNSSSEWLADGAASWTRYTERARYFQWSHKKYPPLELMVTHSLKPRRLRHGPWLETTATTTTACDSEGVGRGALPSFMHGARVQPPEGRRDLLFFVSRFFRFVLFRGRSVGPGGDGPCERWTARSVRRCQAGRPGPGGRRAASAAHRRRLASGRGSLPSAGARRVATVGRKGGGAGAATPPPCLALSRMPR